MLDGTFVLAAAEVATTKAIERVDGVDCTAMAEIDVVTNVGRIGVDEAADGAMIDEVANGATIGVDEVSKGATTEIGEVAGTTELATLATVVLDTDTDCRIVVGKAFLPSM